MTCTAMRPGPRRRMEAPLTCAPEAQRSQHCVQRDSFASAIRIVALGEPLQSRDANISSSVAGAAAAAMAQSMISRALRAATSVALGVRIVKRAFAQGCAAAPDGPRVDRDVAG